MQPELTDETSATLITEEENLITMSTTILEPQVVLIVTPEILKSDFKKKMLNGHFLPFGLKGLPADV